ncbi:MAG TPA: hypothetical protein VLD37_06925, partial [Candidatus Bilamarchaeum sp.]|nr:hypothetical protein [Candidatus Bilamarchaeum sp.]
EQSISKGMDGLEGFPETSFWALFKEVAGQALMERALHGSAPEETRGMLFSKGLMLASRASGPGFPLMGETTALVSEGKSKFPESASMADKLLMKGDDRKSFRKTGEDPPPKKAARKRA